MGSSTDKGLTIRYLTPSILGLGSGVSRYLKIRDVEMWELLLQHARNVLRFGIPKSNEDMLFIRSASHLDRGAF